MANKVEQDEALKIQNNMNLVEKLKEESKLLQGSLEFQIGDSENQDNETEEKQQVFEYKFEKEDLKIMMLDQVPLHIQERMKPCVQTLLELNEEVKEKRELAIEKSKLVKTKVSHLVSSGKVKVDKEEYKKSEVSVREYVKLLNHIISEIEEEIRNVIPFVLNKPLKLIVPKDERTDLDLFVESKIRAVKKYIKSIRRDVTISYSRYCFGFDAQIQKIMMIESYIKKSDSNQKD